MKTNWIALIPAYEPTELLCELLELLEQAKQAGFELIIVNDGSSPAARSFSHGVYSYGSLFTGVLEIYDTTNQ